MAITNEVWFIDDTRTVVDLTTAISAGVATKRILRARGVLNTSSSTPSVGDLSLSLFASQGESVSGARIAAATAEKSTQPLPAVVIDNNSGGSGGSGGADLTNYFNKTEINSLLTNKAGTSLATTTTSGLMPSADKIKLNTVAENATVNDTDANLRNRSSHTGTQAISTVTGLQTALNAAVKTVNNSAPDVNGNVSVAAGNGNILVLNQAQAIPEGTPNGTLIARRNT